MNKYQLLKDQLAAAHTNNNNNNEETEISTLATITSPNPHISQQINEEIDAINEKIEVWQGRLSQTLLETSEPSQQYSLNNRIYKAILCGENMSYLINKTSVCIVDAG